jgi:ferredoxin-NADP reductase
MDREAGIAAYKAMVSVEDYKARLVQDDDSVVHRYTETGTSPVIPAIITRAETSADGIVIYEFQPVSGEPLPPWQAGAHLDVVVAPEFLRQYSMSGDPADRSKYQIAVLREDEGRGGSKLMHRIFAEGRRVFISHPINHFPLDPAATKSILMGGGIGITPMIAMAHELHAKGADFELHYSGRSRETMSFMNEIMTFPWADQIHLHVTGEGTRADFDQIMAGYRPGWHLYTCGGEGYMAHVMEAASRAGFPEDACHLEYFSVPETPDYVNHDFTLKLARSGKELRVPADQSATDVLNANGVTVDVKCSDGICGVCKCGVLSGEVEHRDFVLSKAQQETGMILCQSRALKPGGTLEIDL